MTPRVLRRLLVVSGLLLVGWLLGNSGQAHADAGHGLGARAHDVAVGSLPHANVVSAVQAARAARVRPVDAVRSKDAARVADAPVKAIALGGAAGHRVAVPVIRPRGLVRGVVATAERDGDLVRRQGGITPMVTLPVHGIGSDPARAPRHSLVAVPGERVESARHAAVHESRAATRGGGSVAAFGAEVMDTGRCGRSHARTAPATPAPPAGFPHRAAGESGALPSAGSASAGGLAGHPTRSAAEPRPPVVLKSVLGAVPPAVHTAADEPAISPD